MSDTRSKRVNDLTAENEALAARATELESLIAEINDGWRIMIDGKQERVAE